MGPSGTWIGTRPWTREPVPSGSCWSEVPRLRGCRPGQPHQLRLPCADAEICPAARFDAAHEIHVEVLRRGRGFSTLETRTLQAGKLCSVGILLLDSGAPDTIRGAVEPPDVPPPEA